MPESSLARVVSLVLAFSVVVGGWFLFEYGNEPVAPTEPATDIAKPQVVTSAPGLAATPPALAPRDMNVTYKCESSGRISYSDKPCVGKEKTLAVAASAKEPPTPNISLEQLQQRAAAMKAERLERERMYDAKNVASTTKLSNANQGKQDRCQEIDRAIIVKDSELRQPHAPQWGDYLTGERKKLYDERFSLGC